MKSLPTEYTSKDGRVTPITAMVDRHLFNSIAVLERGPMDDEKARTHAALTQERDRRVSAGQWSMSATAASAPAAKGDSDPKDNHPPAVDEKAEYAKAFRDGAEAQALDDRFAALELAAARLPKAEAIRSDADVAMIDGWMRDSAQLERDLTAFHTREKAPWLMRGQVVDEFKRDLTRTLTAKRESIEGRKKAYLLAKAASEKAAREAQADAERKAAAEQRRREEEAAAAQREAERRAQEEQARLARAAADQEAAEASAYAQADADEAEVDLTTTRLASEDVFAAQDRLQDAQLEADQHGEAAAAAARAAENAEDRAALAARLANAPTHTLARVGESGLKSVWKARIVSARAFSASLGPLEPFLAEADITRALERAAKADPRPTIAGVVFEEDFEVATNLRRKA